MPDRCQSQTGCDGAVTCIVLVHHGVVANGVALCAFHGAVELLTQMRSVAALVAMWDDLRPSSREAPS
jgi:hypothetical protein